MTKEHSEEIGYRVEVRNPFFSKSRVIRLEDGIVGPDWRTFNFSKSDNPAGIPLDPYGYKAHHDLLSLKGAIALAWTLVAQDRLNVIECRIVSYKLITDVSLRQEGVVDMSIIKNDFFGQVKPIKTGKE